jgi:hypothetical protein
MEEVHRFYLIGCLARFNSRFVCMSGCLGQMMAKQQVTDCLPFNTYDNTSL